MNTIDNLMALAADLENAASDYANAASDYAHDCATAIELKILNEAREALRTALTEALDHIVSVNDMVAQPVMEPVAWWITGKKTDEKFVTTRPDDWSNKNWNKHQLYAAPQPVREPLSDEWIRERTKQLWVFETVKQWVKEVELAHGIGGER